MKVNAKFGNGLGSIIFLVIAVSQILTPGIIYGDEAEAPEVVSVDKQSLDILWMLIASALVFIMQAGFMCLESGFARAKTQSMLRSRT